MHGSIASPSLWRTAFALIIASEGATAHATRSSVRPRPHGQVFPRDCRRCEHCARVCRAAGFLRHRAQRPQRGDLHCRHFPRTPHVEPARRHVFGPAAIHQANRMLQSFMSVDRSIARRCIQANCRRVLGEHLPLSISEAASRTGFRASRCTPFRAAGLQSPRDGACSARLCGGAAELCLHMQAARLVPGGAATARRLGSD